MNDIRRTVLWVIFASSLLFLWDAWNTQNGHPSLLSFGAKRGAATPGVANSPAASSGPAALPAPAPVDA